MFLANLLRDLGFSENEASMYLALLELKGFHKASEIANKANLKRTTGYCILNDLWRKDICKCKNLNNIKYFTLNASLIDNLKAHIDKQKLKAAENEQKFLKATPFLQKLSPFATFYEGIEEIKIMYEDILKEKTEISAFINLNGLDKEIAGFLTKDFLPKLTANGIKSNLICTEFINTKINKDFFANCLTKHIILPYNLFNFQGQITIYNKKISFCAFSPTELIGAIIQSQTLSAMMKSIFQLCWQIGYEYDEFLRSIE
ncbi:hypothetical protein A2307_04295 [Candidatus Peregrinibacteria bacterium RIFOXYB2_FULL_33_20]|nr:MAG: hypothetical protein A2263_01970 [Candidatus Peregrinibacteria bacterium RIFOXYA2_FULL_33_21]OGJ50129.1 MAG: hypothetical protein A2307_04295 [Candidatus Peregrinibacteria bacterium RIFOXYB2_FULL_33_20]